MKRLLLPVLLASTFIACSGGEASTTTNEPSGYDGGDGATSQPDAAGPDDSSSSPLGACTKPTWSKALAQSYTGGNSERVSSDWFGVAVADDESVYATGRYSGIVDFGNGTKGTSAGPSVSLVKWKPDGTIAWVKVFDATWDMLGGAVAAAPGGGVIFGGATTKAFDVGGKTVSRGSGIEPGAFVARLDGAGSAAWVATFADVSRDRVEQLLVVDSQVFALVSDYKDRVYNPMETGPSYRIERFDLATGARKQLTSLGFYFPLRDQFARMAPAADGGVFVSYQVSKSPDEYPAELVKVDAAGTLSFTKAFSKFVPGTAPSFVLWDVAADAAGGLVAITTGDHDGFEDPSLSRFDANGVLSWSRKIDPGKLSLPVAGLHATKDEIRVVSTAAPSCGTAADVWMMRFSPAGAPLATHTYPFSLQPDSTYHPFRAAFGATTFAIAGTESSAWSSFVAQLRAR